MDNIIITTTDNVEGHTIKKYIGIVSSHSYTLSKNLAGYPEKDRIKALPEYRDFFKKLESNLAEEAKAVDANAVVGIKFHFAIAPLGTTIYAHGTAVIIE